MSVPQKVVVLSTDLMDRSRFDPLRALDVEVVFVRRAPDVLESITGPTAGAGTDTGRTVLVVDLARPDALEAIGQGVAAEIDVVAYGSHVDRNQLDLAHAVGARSFARSAFFGRLLDALG
jgi:hypothetical protein